MASFRSPRAGPGPSVDCDNFVTEVGCRPDRENSRRATSCGLTGQASLLRPSEGPPSLPSARAQLADRAPTGHGRPTRESRRHTPMADGPLPAAGRRSGGITGLRRRRCLHAGRRRAGGGTAVGAGTQPARAGRPSGHIHSAGGSGCWTWWPHSRSSRAPPTTIGAIGCPVRRWSAAFGQKVRSGAVARPSLSSRGWSVRPAPGTSGFVLLFAPVDEVRPAATNAMTPGARTRRRTATQHAG